jgi:regulator of cell morphogenesis and NO signaling
MNYIKKSQTVGQIVASYPYLAEVFNKYKIDYTFRGDLILESILKELGLSEYDFIGELNLAVEEFKLLNEDVIYWENEPIGKILDFIEEKHHKFTIDTLNKIDKLLFGVSLKNHDELKKLFSLLKNDLETHQLQEERNLFPLLREYNSNRTKELRDKIIRYMTETEDEHDMAGKLLKQIHRLTEGYRVPLEGEETLTPIYRLLDALEKDAYIHIHMENSILFKMI